MGLLGCQASFQRLMEKAMEGIEACIVYIDDLLIHSNTHQKHLVILDKVMCRLVNNGLKINLDKCFFGNTEVSYLGFTLTPKGITPGKDKLACIKRTTPPTSVKMVCSFIGLCNFFRTHIKNFHTLAQPLNKLLCKDSPWKGGLLPPDASNEFYRLCAALISDPIVAYPRADYQYALIVNASTGTATTPLDMGFILAQTDESQKFLVIFYGSRQLVDDEKTTLHFS